MVARLAGGGRLHGSLLDALAHVGRAGTGALGAARARWGGALGAGWALAGRCRVCAHNYPYLE